MIPDFRDDGYLPEGLHLATETEITNRFGTATAQRRYLIGRLKRWIELSRLVEAKRLLVDGSFVTEKPDPNDVDAVVWVPDDFDNRYSRGDAAACELGTMLLTRLPEEIFAAEDRRDWDNWVEYFSQTLESDRRKKGLVEVEL